MLQLTIASLHVLDDALVQVSDLLCTCYLCHFGMGVLCFALVGEALSTSLLCCINAVQSE